MAILSESVEDEPQDVGALLTKLCVPAEFARYETLEDKQVIVQLDEWRMNALKTLEDLCNALKQNGTEVGLEVVYACAAFQGDGEWTSEDMNTLASDSLTSAGDPSLFLEDIFAQRLKPLFQKNPHPMLDTETARKLPKSAGGYAAAQDAYEGQVWKEQPGIGNILLWCVQHIDTDAYERMWYLVVPPVMTLLDDFEAKYKLTGIRVINAMLERVPPSLLSRTGIAELILSSLSNALTFLHSPHTPAILRAAIPAAVNLIERTTKFGSEERFNQLCALLGDGVIGSVWMYSSGEADAIEASVGALPCLVHALGIGTTRYLKALIPQLTHPLHPVPYKTPHPRLQLSSLRALRTVIQECAPRMEKWKGTIIEGVAKCWVVLEDTNASGEGSEKLRHELRGVCVELLEVAPSVRNEYARILKLDSKIFEGLVGDMLVADSSVLDTA
ncbi:hypothetical protein BC834DRAFT_900075 [Gloeopeniophorella convolvens]|nr:hypothetical protein BC834DRAFT_900075 [Gloeopeniophorella convolvens]